MTATEFSD